MTADSILDEMFHSCALLAYLEQAAEQQAWPDSEATRRRAYALYENALRAKNDGQPWQKKGRGRSPGP
jgi:hypothetical protein